MSQWPVVKVLCPNESTGHLIGSKGHRVNEISRAHRCKIYTSATGCYHPCFVESKQRVVSITGKLPDVLNVVGVIREITSRIDGTEEVILLLSLPAADHIYHVSNTLSKHFGVSISLMKRRAMLKGLEERWCIIGCGSFQNIGDCAANIISDTARFQTLSVTTNYKYALFSAQKLPNLRKPNVRAITSSGESSGSLKDNYTPTRNGYKPRKRGKPGSRTSNTDYYPDIKISVCEEFKDMPQLIPINSEIVANYTVYTIEKN